MGKVLCSGELFTGPIDPDTCLACALARVITPCGYSYPLLKAIFQDDEQDERSETIHVTDLTGCLRKAALDKLDPEPEYVHHRLILWIGKAIHADIARACEGDPHVASEMVVSDPVSGVVGRVDAVLGGTLMDFKTTRWLDIDKLPYGTHEAQLNFYNALSGQDHALAIQYMDMSGAPTHKIKDHQRVMQKTGGIVQCPECGYSNGRQHLGAALMPVVESDREEVLAQVRRRAAILKAAMDGGKLPDPEPSFLCSYCSHQKCEFNPKGAQR